jgi:dihydroneopterin aldolase
MKVFVENLEFEGRHGVYAEERREGRLFRVDIAAELDRWAQEDDVDETLDYCRLADIVFEVGHGESLQLLETMARRIIDRAFRRYEQIAALSLSIRKKATGVAGDPEWVGASFEIDRKDWRAQEG